MKAYFTNSPTRYLWLMAPYSDHHVMFLQCTGWEPRFHQLLFTEECPAGRNLRDWADEKVRCMESERALSEN